MMENDRSGKNTDELLSVDVDEEVDVYGVIPLALSRDHCDVLLDVIDTQLSHLQIHSQSKMHGANSTRYEFPFLGYLDRSQSVSKDTGLWSTVPTNDKTPSNLDGTQSEGKDDKTEHQTMEMIKFGVAATDVWCPEESGSLSSVSSVVRDWRGFLGEMLRWQGWETRRMMSQWTASALRTSQHALERKYWSCQPQRLDEVNQELGQSEED
ncbi:uncharacterized protein LOC122137435 [Cyprinus carpio]|uniref:Uncharacterized protein LOC122137435 n=1 Tax=Cyprinus carpio TaxID=7962 RepID=A0A9Q9WAK2_CYPCA|nr:uncharacterized protein LOC122137435 [Cyprinus carpio]